MSSNARQLAANLPREGGLSNRNLIINGGLSIWQRGVSFSNAWNYGADRWVHPVAQTKGQLATEGTYSTFTGQGSANGAYAFTSVELPTVGSNFPFTVGQSFTLSFRVNSTSRVKPDFAFRNGVVGASNGFTTDTIDYKGGSGSWETVSWTITVTATCGGSDNCLSISFMHEDANASVSMTQVQLEVGDTATPFEHRSYGDELQRCLRYFYKAGDVTSGATYHRFAVGYNNTSTNNNSIFHLPVVMRAKPSVSQNGTLAIYSGSAGVYNTTAIVIETGGSGDHVISLNSTTSGITQGNVGSLIGSNDTSARLNFDAEL